MKQAHAVNYLSWLGAILLLKVGAMLLIILKGGIGLGPDEAQYWTWSQALDWGYYSKPPGIAWQIWLGVQMFGNTELGVRAGALLLSTLSALAVYSLARNCRLHASIAFWAAILFAFSPLGMLASLFAITDGGLFLFWTLACSLVAFSLTHTQSLNYPLLGSVLLAGALFKWPIYLFWIFLCACWPFVPAFRSPKILVGIAISLLGLLPSFVWNWQHEWATFRHVAATVEGSHASAAAGNFWGFVGAQLALLSPIVFILMCLSFWKSYQERKVLAPALLFCSALCFLVLVGFGFQSFFQKIQGNWVDFAYAGGFVGAAWYGCEKLAKGRTWMLGGGAVSICLSFFAFSLPFIQSHGILPISYRINPFRHHLGWNRLDAALSQAGYNPEKHFLFGDKYQTASILSFYGEGQKRAYFLNLQGIRKNQFSYWPSMSAEQTGKTGYFLLADNIPGGAEDLLSQASNYETALASYFDQVECLGFTPLFSHHLSPVKGVLIFKCRHYNGKIPPETAIY